MKAIIAISVLVLFVYFVVRGTAPRPAPVSDETLEQTEPDQADIAARTDA